MVAEGRRASAPLSEDLFRRSTRYDFFQAVRLLERLCREQPAADARARRHPVGEDHAPGEEVVRFRAAASLSFPAGAISSLRASPASAVAPESSLPPEMAVNFMGLTGPHGALPPHYTALVLARIREKDFALRDFLDLFNHRLISLFYRAWRKYRFAMQYERNRLGEETREDLFTRCLYCLVGLGWHTRREQQAGADDGSLRERLELDDRSLVYYGGHFAHYPRGANSLERVLSDYFALPVRVEQFQGQWLYLEPDDRSLLPSRRHAGGLNNRLGCDVVVGERVWNVQSRFRVRVGPVGYREFRQFLPTGDALRPLCQLTRTYVGPELDFDVQMVLRAREVPWCRLGAAGADEPRLGWNTWVRGRAFVHDVADAVFFLEDV